MSSDEIVATFIRDYRRLAQDEAGEFQRLPSLSEAIRCAAPCYWLPELKRHPHQRRIPGALLVAVEQRLQTRRDELSQAPDFETLHHIVDREVGGMRGIGDLTVYDIAHRIGAFLGKAPSLVYLHAGARAGARFLGFTGTTVNPTQLPPAFSRLTAAEIEDCLYIYKRWLRPGALGNRFLQPPNPCFPEPSDCVRKS